KGGHCDSRLSRGRQAARCNEGAVSWPLPGVLVCALGGDLVNASQTVFQVREVASWKSAKKSRGRPRKLVARSRGAFASKSWRSGSRQSGRTATPIRREKTSAAASKRSGGVRAVAVIGPSLAGRRRGARSRFRRR